MGGKEDEDVPSVSRRKSLQQGKSIGRLQSSSAISLCCTCRLLFSLSFFLCFVLFFVFCFFSPRKKHLLLMTRHEAPGAKDRYLCPEHSSIEGIVSLRAAAWLNKTLNSEPGRPPGPKHLKAEVPLGAFIEQRMNTNNNNVTLIVLCLLAPGAL